MNLHSSWIRVNTLHKYNNKHDFKKKKRKKNPILKRKRKKKEKRKKAGKNLAKGSPRLRPV